MISGSTDVFGIFGYPVKHTFSPAMHNAAFSKLAIDACYIAFEVHPGRLVDAVRAIPALGLRGINITVPHKEKVISHLDELSDEARLIGAVNTIEVKEGRLIGHNTDGRGFLRSLREEAGFIPRGKRFLIVGSGGAARAVGISLALAGAVRIHLSDIDRQKGEGLATDISSKTGVESSALSPDNLADSASEADCIINATPLGLKKKDSMPLSKDHIRKSHLICDLVYNPTITPFLKSAKSAGARQLPGIGMLLFQGVIAFEIWTSRRAPVETMKKALKRQISLR